MTKPGKEINNNLDFLINAANEANFIKEKIEKKKKKTKIKTKTWERERNP